MKSCTAERFLSTGGRFSTKQAISKLFRTGIEVDIAIQESEQEYSFRGCELPLTRAIAGPNGVFYGQLYPSLPELLV